MGELSPPARRIIVVGGGITGLAAAHRVQELAREQGRPVRLLLLEAAPRVGGILRTDRLGAFLLERGPDAFLADREKPWALALCRRLGLEPQLLETDPTHRRSFLVKGHRLLPVPEGFHLLAPASLWPFARSPIVSWPGKLRMAMDVLLPGRPQDGDESLAHFVVRRLGCEALERVAQPMIAGIYGADPKTLSLRATMPRFLEMERTHGSVIRALRARRRQAAGSRRSPDEGEKGGSVAPPAPSDDATRKGGDRESANRGVSGARYGLFLSFQDGVQTLVDALAARLPEGCLRASTRVERLSRRTDGVWQVVVSSTGSEECELLEADALCLALPAYRAAALLREIDASLADQLEAIPYRSSATVNLGYRRSMIQHPLDGFGFVAPEVERRLTMGCTFSSVKFPGRAPEGHVLLRAFLSERALEGRDDSALVTGVRQDLDDLLGITAPPLFAEVWRHERSMAQYLVGHLDRVAAIEAATARHPGLALAGNAYRGIGIPDCIHGGELAAEQLLTG